MNRITTFYRFPDLDARIGLIMRDNQGAPDVHVAFMAKGNAYKGTGTARKLYKRNPDRTAAVDRLLAALADSGHIFLCARYGKASTPIAYPGEGTPRALYSKGGNYRFDLLFERMGDIDPEALGLIPCENRPVPTAF